MIIEGKHAEVGQGIFISDIQEGSAAEQAGLTVGDMILAVNKDSLLGSNYDAAASLLKETKGMVNLVVCNPNKAKEEERKGADGKLNAKGSTARSPTPTQPAAPEKPRLLDSQNITVSASSRSAHHSPSRHPEQPALPPATAPVVAGQETTIEIAKEDKALGIFVVGGSDTPLGVIVIHEIYPDGAVAKDGRLKVGDQILEVGGPKDSVTHDFHSITHAKAIAALRQLPAKVKMIVYRDEAVEKEEDIYESIEVELTKKSGKGLGLSLVVRKDGKGVYISDLVHGGAAEADGRLMKGDMIVSVNGQDLKSASQEEAAAVLKTALGKVTIKVGRIKTGKIKCPTSHLITKRRSELQGCMLRYNCSLMIKSCLSYNDAVFFSISEFTLNSVLVAPICCNI
ncbi:Multiple PDZ domain protein [Frankliniella fusca]|uniref:Multiple PDZ domain protein n=1 Tax=Frankliniella fusca TaxID=407009 RepID=A0AAE1I4J7_9NEOP|nr:Multiple PDZ domain protein [Frankliniella fusca]